jgi:adenylate cyclase
VAETIEALYPEAPEHIESLAHHYDRGGDVGQAVAYLSKAGEKAKRSYANEEAITHLKRRLALVRSLAEGPERDRLELDTLIALGVPLVLTQGHSALEVQSVYDQARELSARLDDTGLQFHALLGLRRSALLREGLDAALALGEQLLALAQRTGDAGQLARAHMMHAEAYRLHGDFSQARHHCEHGLACFDPQQRPAHVFLYGNDTGIGCQNTLVEVLWALGYPDQAAEEAENVLVLARELAHPFTLVFALHATAVARQFRREASIVQRQAETVIRITQEHGFPLYLSLARVQRGWALAVQGQVDAGIQEIQTGVAARRATGATTLLPDLLMWLAEAYGQAGQVRRALDQLDEAQRMAAANGEHLTEAEMFRLKGELLLKAQKDAAQAEENFQRALDVARRQGAKSWELRAATSLARLWQRQGRAADARVLLEGIYGWFSEGLDTGDLIEAQALLEILQAPGTGGGASPAQG